MALGLFQSRAYSVMGGDSNMPSDQESSPATLEEHLLHPVNLKAAKVLKAGGLALPRKRLRSKSAGQRAKPSIFTTNLVPGLRLGKRTSWLSF